AGLAIRALEAGFGHADRCDAQISDAAAGAAHARIYGEGARDLGGAETPGALSRLALARLYARGMERELGDFGAGHRGGRLGAERSRDRKAKPSGPQSRNPGEVGGEGSEVTFRAARERFTFPD